MYIYTYIFIFIYVHIHMYICEYVYDKKMPGGCFLGERPDVERARNFVSPGHPHSFRTTKRKVAF